MNECCAAASSRSSGAFDYRSAASRGKQQPTKPANAVVFCIFTVQEHETWMEEEKEEGS